MTRRTKAYILISCSAAVFVYLFINSIIGVVRIFTHLDDFNLFPALMTIVYLVILFVHAALYVFYMDKKDKTHQVEDDEEWWTKWDRV